MNTISPTTSQGCQVPAKSLSDMLLEIDNNLEYTTRTLGEMIFVLTGEDVPCPYDVKVDGNAPRIGHLEKINELAKASDRIRVAANRLLDKVL